MRNSKYWIRAILILIVVAGILFGLDYALYPCTFMRNDIHAVCTEQFDDLYLGTSHGKMNIDPDSASEINGRSGHNVCVGGEYAVDAYNITKLAIEKGNKPDRIIYEVSAGYFMSQKEEGNNYLLFYHEFPLSLTKLSYFKDTLLKCNFRTMLFPWYEYSLSYELGKLQTTLNTKLSGDFSTENLKSSTQEYHEDGFIERYPVDEADFSAMNLTEFKEEDVAQTNMDYLTKLIDLCKKEDITFVAVTTPMPKVTLQEYADGFVNMDTYFSEYFEEQGVRYINFNSRTYYKRFSHKIGNFTDYDGHMNGDAARSFSKVLAEVLDEEE